MASPPSDWEAPEQAWEYVEFGGDGSDEDDIDYDQVAQAEAGEEFYNMLIHLKGKGTLSAKQTCVLAFWASRAGAQGQAGSLALAPDKQSGKYSSKYDSVVHAGSDNDDFYSLELPTHNKFDSTRETMRVPVMPAQDALFEELHRQPQLRGELQRQRASRSLPPCFYDHPVVTSAPEGALVVPIALYLDGVRFAKRDAVLSVFCYNVVSGRRHLLATLRKSKLCRCGRRGWCSLFELFRFLRWSVDSLAVGAFPRCRHSGEAFFAAEGARAAVANMGLGFVGAVLYIKGDWAEFANTLGMPTWSSKFNPCPLCHVSLSELDDASGLSVEGTTFAPKTHEEYEAACAACELPRLLTQAAYRAVRAALVYEKSKTSTYRGRVLGCDLPALDLLKGDRLEPCQTVPSTLEFDFVATFPVAVVFWRAARETSARHRTPLCNRATGVTVQRCLAMDSLHCLSLGCYALFLMNLFHLLIERNVWNVPDSTVGGRFEASVARLRGGVVFFAVRV